MFPINTEVVHNIADAVNSGAKFMLLLRSVIMFCTVVGNASNGKSVVVDSSSNQKDSSFAITFPIIQHRKSQHHQFPSLCEWILFQSLELPELEI